VVMVLLLPFLKVLVNNVKSFYHFAKLKSKGFLPLLFISFVS